MNKVETITFFVAYGLLLVGIVTYYWRWALKKGREEIKKEFPEIYRLKNDDTLTDLQRDILLIQSFKRDNNRMAIKITYDNSLNHQQIENLHNYIKENEVYIMKKREELIEKYKDE